MENLKTKQDKENEVKLLKVTQEVAELKEKVKTISIGTKSYQRIVVSEILRKLDNINIILE